MTFHPFIRLCHPALHLITKHSYPAPPTTRLSWGTSFSSRWNRPWGHFTGKQCISLSVHVPRRTNPACVPGVLALQDRPPPCARPLTKEEGTDHCGPPPTSFLTSHGSGPSTLGWALLSSAGPWQETAWHQGWKWTAWHDPSDQKERESVSCPGLGHT